MTFGKNIQKILGQSLHDSVFMQFCFIINFSSFKPDTENNGLAADVFRLRRHTA